VVTLSSDSTDFDTFTSEVEQFLSRRLPRRQDTVEPAGAHQVIEVHGLELRPEQDAAKAVEEATRWQAERFDAGLGWITGPRRYGGRGLTVEFERVYRDREAAYMAPDLTPLNVGTKMLSAAILGHGSEFVRGQLLPALHRGDLIGCQLFSEPDAGSDLSAVRTSASLHGGIWELVGEKVWTSKAQFSDVGLCIARTEATADRHDGLTMFLVDMRASGVEVRPLRQMNGHASFNHVVLDKAQVPDSYRLGEAGEGWAVVRTTLMSERAGVGQGAKDPAANALERLEALARHGGSGLAVPPLTRQGMADLYSRVRIAEFAGHRAQAAPGPAGSINKLLRSRNLQHASTLATQMVGARAMADAGVAQEWADFVLCVPGVRVAGGTDEIQLNVLAERVLGLPRDPR
jgi:alkylation response protein AidB-like acyl-CoA dehydrogenase